MFHGLQNGQPYIARVHLTMVLFTNSTFPALRIPLLIVSLEFGVWTCGWSKHGNKAVFLYQEVPTLYWPRAW